MTPPVNYKGTGVNNQEHDYGGGGSSKIMSHTNNNSFSAYYVPSSSLASYSSSNDNCSSSSTTNASASYCVRSITTVEKKALGAMTKARRLSTNQLCSSDSEEEEEKRGLSSSSLNPKIKPQGYGRNGAAPAPLAYHDQSTYYDSEGYDRASSSSSSSSSDGDYDDSQQRVHNYGVDRQSSSNSGMRSMTKRDKGKISKNIETATNCLGGRGAAIINNNNNNTHNPYPRFYQHGGNKKQSSEERRLQDGGKRRHKHRAHNHGHNGRSSSFKDRSHHAISNSVGKDEASGINVTKDGSYGHTVLSSNGTITALTATCSSSNLSTSLTSHNHYNNGSCILSSDVDQQFHSNHGSLHRSLIPKPSPSISTEADSMSLSPTTNKNARKIRKSLGPPAYTRRQSEEHKDDLAREVVWHGRGGAAGTGGASVGANRHCSSNIASNGGLWTCLSNYDSQHGNGETVSLYSGSHNPRDYQPMAFQPKTRRRASSVVTMDVDDDKSITDGDPFSSSRGKYSSNKKKGQKRRSSIDESMSSRWGGFLFKHHHHADGPDGPISSGRRLSKSLSTRDMLKDTAKRQQQSCCATEFMHNLKTMKNNPKIIVISLSVFVTVLLCSVLTVQALHHRYVTQMNNQAVTVAEETLEEVLQLWNQAFMSLYSIQQAIHISPQLEQLFSQIKHRLINSKNSTTNPESLNFSERNGDIVRVEESYIETEPKAVVHSASSSSASAPFPPHRLERMRYRERSTRRRGVRRQLRRGDETFVGNLVHANVTGICDVPHVQQLLNDVIVPNLHNQFDCTDVLREVRLAPQNIVCVSAPVSSTTNNVKFGLDLSQSFFDGAEKNPSVLYYGSNYYADSHDDPYGIVSFQEWQNAINTRSRKNVHRHSNRPKDPRNYYHSHHDDIAISGPLSIRAATKKNANEETGEATSIVDEALLGHLDIPIPAMSMSETIVSQNDVKHGHARHLEKKMEMKEREPSWMDVPLWGSVQVIIDWGLVKERQSTLYQRLNETGMEFIITRNNVVVAKSTQSNLLQDEGMRLNHMDNQKTLRTVQSVTTNVSGEETWTQTVGYTNGYDMTFYYVGLALAIVGSFVASAIIALTLVERRNHKTMLYKLMPKSAIFKLSRNQTVVEHFDQVTIFFSDIIGFTSMAGEMSPIQVMRMLNELYSQFDKIVAKHKIYKVETIGDAYMVVGGAPDQPNISKELATERVALFALDVIEFVKTFETSDGVSVQIRAGLASGPVVGGVVGSTMPRYCFFGDTVNFASRMESTSQKMKVQCCPLTQKMLQRSPNQVFYLKDRMDEITGDRGIEVKGKGLIYTSWVVRAKPRTQQLADNAIRVYTLDQVTERDSTVHTLTNDDDDASISEDEDGDDDIEASRCASATRKREVQVLPASHFGAKSLLHRMRALPPEVLDEEDEDNYSQSNSSSRVSYGVPGEEGSITRSLTNYQEASGTTILNDTSLHSNSTSESYRSSHSQRCTQAGQTTGSGEEK